MSTNVNTKDSTSTALVLTVENVNGPNHDPDPIPYYNQPKRQTTRFMTKYERARILGARALQINMGAHILVDVGNESDALAIATKELHHARIPLTIRRKLPDGTIEATAVKDLILAEEMLEEDFTVALQD